MIQRLQSLLFLFSAIFSILIIYTFPVLQDGEISLLLKEDFAYARLCLFFSSALSLFAIFQFRNRQRQKLLASFARLMITITFLLIILLHSEGRVLGIGLILLVIPFIFLIAAQFFINRDEKLVRSADRIR